MFAGRCLLLVKSTHKVHSKMGVKKTDYQRIRVENYDKVIACNIVYKLLTGTVVCTKLKMMCCKVISSLKTGHLRKIEKTQAKKQLSSLHRQTRDNKKGLCF